MSQQLRTIRSSIMLFLLFVSAATAGGLRTQLGEVVLENLQVGQEYNLKDLANLNLRVTNTSEYSVVLRMDVLAPDEAELKHEARAIPDLSWIRLSCDSFSLDAGQEAVSEILISIPDDEQYLGQRYQFMIWSHTVPGTEGGMFLATGLKSRIIFTIDTVRADLSDETVAQSGNAGFSVTPSEIHLTKVPQGRKYDVREAEGVALTVKNPTSRELTLRLYSKSISGSLASLEPGWEETPDANFLTFERDEVKVPPDSEQIINLYLQIPDDTAHRGKRLMFLIHACDETAPVTTGVYVRLFAILE